MMTSMLAWFEALEDKRKLQFLAFAGVELTTFAKNGATTDQLKSLNEIYHQIYKTLGAVAAGNQAFDAAQFWNTLNSLAVSSGLDVALQATFAGAKSMTETLKTLT